MSKSRTRAHSGSQPPGRPNYVTNLALWCRYFAPGNWQLSFPPEIVSHLLAAATPYKCQKPSLARRRLVHADYWPVTSGSRSGSKRGKQHRAIAKITARCALYSTRLPWKFSGVHDYAHGYFSEVMEYNNERQPRIRILTISLITYGLLLTRLQTVYHHRQSSSVFAQSVITISSTEKCRRAGQWSNIELV